jgi:PPK2 family polyphosphate:nucleotide phosphotransferase
MFGGDGTMNPKNRLKAYRVDDPGRLRLSDFDPADDGGLDKDEAKAILAEDIERLRELQERLYADGRWAILVVLQAMDAAGKDGVIKHVMSGLNPQGCVVHPFKPPNPEELAHDFLWRSALRLPERGHIGIHNRSHYEEVLSVRVRPQYLKAQRIPEALATKDIWKHRFKDIRAFERHLSHSGTIVLKFFLHISKEEQKRRFLDRLEQPGKRWKFSMGDVEDRKLWDKYMAAYEDAIRATSRPEAPWYVVPADHKPYARLVVAKALIDALEAIDLKFPKVDAESLKEMEAVKRALLAEKA